MNRVIATMGCRGCETPGQKQSMLVYCYKQRSQLLLCCFLAVLFEDAVILGIGTDNVSDVFSPGFSKKNLFSSYNLERTVSTYLYMQI